MKQPIQNDVPNTGTLNDELQALSDRFLNVAPEEVQEILLEHLRQWKSTEILQESLKEGDVAPDFVLPDQDGNLVSSVDLRAKGPIVVVFFRGNWCAYCNATLRMIRKYTPHFKARGATVVAMSPQSVAESKIARNNAGLTFPVLSDAGSQYAQLLRIAYVLDDRVQTLYEESFGRKFADINPSNEYKNAVLPIPATYVIEMDGRVAYSFLDTDYTKRAEPVEVLNALPPLRTRRLSLSERMDVEMGKLRDTHPERQMRILFDAVELYKAQHVERQALQVGQKAPDFAFRGQDGQWINSEKLRRNGPLIVTFHYGHESPLCMIQMEAMQRYLPKFEAKGASLVSIAATPKISRTATTTNKKGLQQQQQLQQQQRQAMYYGGLKFPMIPDHEKHSVAEQFGLLYQLPTGHLFFGGAGRNPSPPQGDNGDNWVDLPMAATYLIDRDGTILYAHVHADPTVRAEPSRILQAIPNQFQRTAPVKRGPFSLLFGGRLAPRAKRVRTDQLS